MITEEDFETAKVENFDEGPALGSGKDGEVIEYINRFNGTKFALKCIPLTSAILSEDQMYEINKQIELFTQQTKKIILHSHPNIVRILYFFVSNDKTKFYIFMEKMKCTVTEAIKARISENYRFFSLPEFKDLVTTLITTFSFLEHLKIAHRDIKSDNLMFSEDGIIKVVDLGESNLGKTGRESFSIEVQGTLSYMAPELKFMYESSLEKSEIATNVYKCDVFSLGLVLLQIACLKKNSEIKGINTRKENGPEKIKILLDGVETRYGSDYKSLLEKMLSFQPSERPSFSELDDFLVTFEKNEVENKNEEVKRAEEEEKREDIEDSKILVNKEMEFVI